MMLLLLYDESAGKMAQLRGNLLLLLTPESWTRFNPEAKLYFISISSLYDDIFGHESCSLNNVQSYFNASIDIHENYVHNVYCQIILFWC